MITVDGMSRRFGDVLALDDVSFEVPSGSICAFVGPNGAGKTTTLRILATLDSPTSGDAFVDGLSVYHQPGEVRARLGYVPDYFGAYRSMIVDEYVDFFARACGLRGAARARRVEELVGFTEIDELLGRPVDALSKGQKQRLSLTRALLADPAVLILDEPAAGLDPRARVELRELLRLLAQQGKSVLISSHILVELADFVDRVVIIDCGQIRYAGTLGELDGLDRGAVLYTLELASDELTARKFLGEQVSVLSVTGTAEELKIRFDASAEPVEETLARMIGAGVRVRQIYRPKDRLQEVFMTVTSDEAVAR